MKAKLKNGSSFTWQSTMSGLDNFKHGYIWHVGDGSKIDIWEAIIYRFTRQDEQYL
jgi:hypothetical protein